MMTREQLRVEYDRLFEAGEYEAAERVLDEMEPVSDEEWHRILRDAPLDDEPLTASELRRLAEFDAYLARQEQRQAG